MSENAWTRRHDLTPHFTNNIDTISDADRVGRNVDASNVCAPDSSEVEAVNIGFVYPEVAIQRAQRLRIASLGIMEHNSRFKDTLCFSQELVRLVGFREDSIALRLGSTQDGPNVSHRAMGSHVYEGFALPGSPKIRKVAFQFPAGTELHEGVDKQQYLALRGCHWITTLAFQLVGEIPLEWLLGSVCDMLSTITDLEELWLASDKWPEYISDETSLESVMLHIAKACPRLKYLRLQARRVRIHRSSVSEPGRDKSVEDKAHIVLEHLGAWEDEVEGPELFRVPYPLP